MPQGTQGNARAKPQTGTARRTSKATSREQMIERTRMVVNNRPLMTIEQVARYLGVSRWTVGRMLDDETLRGVTVNGRRVSVWRPDGSVTRTKNTYSPGASALKLLGEMHAE